MISPDNVIGVENVEVQVDSGNIQFLISIKIDSIKFRSSLMA